MNEEKVSKKTIAKAACSALGVYVLSYVLWLLFRT